MIKKVIILISAMIFFSLVTYVLTDLSYKKNNLYYNKILFSVISNDVTEEEILNILKGNDFNENNLTKYGYDTTDKFLNDNFKDIYYSNIIRNIVIVNLLIIIVFIMYIIHEKKRKIEYNKMINYFSELSNLNYKLEPYDNSLNDLSIFKSEVYKLAISLKEHAENNKKEKISIKDNIVDLSHQLKTPMSGISILVDNILDNPNMDEKTKNEFIKDIRVELNNMEFLIYNLLKLSKFDADVIEFKKDKIKVKELIDLSIDKVRQILEKKKININISGSKDVFLYVDKKWQSEAIANIIKNAAEHSYKNSNIDIEFKSNNFYTEINIIDYGKGIEKEKITKIFNRFYKDKNSSENSIGVGLNLAKTIILKEDGIISVESEKEVKTVFTIKYFKSEETKEE